MAISGRRRSLTWKGVCNDMIRIENHLGTIEIAPEYFRYLIGNAAASCYGVAGMVKSDQDSYANNLDNVGKVYRYQNKSKGN